MRDNQYCEDVDRMEQTSKHNLPVIAAEYKKDIKVQRKQIKCVTIC